MFKLFFFFLGFSMTVFGLVYIIIYLNLLTFGYTFFEYLKFIITRYECLIALFGSIILTITVIMKGDIFNDLYLWHIS